MSRKPTTIESELNILDHKYILNIGYFVLLVTFGVFGIWSFWAPIDSAAHAQGVVNVKSNRRTIQHLEGGIVKQILIKEGASINQEDVLIILDDTQIKAQQEIVRGQLIALSATEARLQAERDNLNAIIFPELLPNNNDKRINDARKGQEQIFNARKSSYLGEISVLNQRISQLQSKKKGLTGQRASNRRLRQSYKEEISDLKDLLAEGFADKQRLREILRNNERTYGDIEKLTAEIATISIQIGETHLHILQLTKQFQEDVVQQLGEIQTNLYDIQERMIALNDKVARTIIKAPVNGVILGLRVHTINAVIAPGEPIMDIVPQNEELIITAQISPLDIDRVYQGLTAEVRFSSFKSALTPVLHGKVIILSADSLTDEKSGQTYFQAQIALNPESYVRLGDIQLLPGMPAEVLINTGERTLFEYLVQPVTDAFARSFIED